MWELLVYRERQSSEGQRSEKRKMCGKYTLQPALYIRKGQGERSRRERDEQRRRRQRTENGSNESNEREPSKEKKREPSRASRRETCERIGSGGG